MWRLSNITEEVEGVRKAPASNSSGGVLLEVKPRRYDLRVPGTRISEIVRERRGITTETSFVLGAIIQDERTLRHESRGG